jgi:hypothetical protein
MSCRRIAAPLRCGPPLTLLAAAVFAAVGAACAQEVAGSGALGMGELALSAESNALATAPIELSHTGARGERLAFHVTPSATACDAPSPAAWLAVEPSSGEIEAGAVATLSVYASAFGVDAPRRVGFLCIATSDVARPLREMHVVLTIDTAHSRVSRHGG